MFIPKSYKSLYTLLLGCIGFIVYGQGYFNNLYPENLGFVTFNVIETGQGFGTICNQGFSGVDQNISIVEFNHIGDTLYNHIIDSSFSFYVGGEGNLTRYPGGYAMAVRSSSPVYTDMLMLLDTNFRFKQFHNLTGASSRFFNQIIYHDKYFYVTGHTFTNKNYPDSLHRREALLMKVDTMGQIVFERNYPEASYRANKVVNRWPYQVEPASDGGMYMASWTFVDYLPGVNIKDSSDFLIIKVDSNGTKQWEKKFGNPSLKDPKLKLLRYSDSSALAFVPYPLQRNFDIPEYNTSNENRIYEVYDDGRPMRLLKAYGPRNGFHGPFGTFRFKNGNFCFYGLSRVYQMDGSKYPGIIIGYTFVLSPQLDSLNFQYHQTPNNSITDYALLYDARPTKDGGIITGGQLRTSESILKNGMPGQHLWLMKLDSLGCATANCQGIGLEEHTLLGAAKVSVHPNPATDKIHINWFGDGSFRSAGYIVYDARGAEIQQGELYSSTQEIHLSNQTPGQYVVVIITDNGTVSTEKLIVK